MYFETFKKKKKKKILIGILLFIILIIILVVSTSKAKYQTTESINIVKGTINYSLGDIIVTAYFNNKKMETIPGKNDNYAIENVTCDKEASATWDNDIWGIKVSNLTEKGTKCNLYFIEYKPSAKEVILSNVSTITARTDFSTTYTTSTTKTIFTAEDNDGTSYYYAGAPTDNWVKFAGFYWRIVRINGDESIRLIYNGTSTNTTGAETQIASTSMFNSEYGNNAHVGFMYTEGSAHGLGTSSTIKGVLDSWYISELASYADYLDINASFCGDRSAYTDKDGTNPGGGTGTTETYYGPYIRLITNKAPTLKCTNSSDLYTINSSEKGNKALTNPVGLITADEIMYAGALIYQTGDSTKNTSYYLYTGNWYWTISPSYNSSGTFVFLEFVGTLNNVGVGVDYGFGVRPVINLRGDIVLSGTGSSTNPYVVEGAN